MVIRVEQCAKFEAIPSIMHGTPQFDPFHQFKIGQEWRVERRKITRIIGSLFGITLQWRNYERDGVSNHRRLNFVYSTVCSGADQRKHQSSALLTCEGNSPITGEFPAVTGEFPAQKPVTRNIFLFDDVIMRTGNIGVECSSMKCEVSAPLWECVLINKINSHPKEFGREPSFPDPPLLILGECPHRGDSSPPPPRKKFKGVRFINAL